MTLADAFESLATAIVNAIDSIIQAVRDIYGMAGAMWEQSEQRYTATTDGRWVDTEDTEYGEWLMVAKGDSI